MARPTTQLWQTSEHRDLLINNTRPFSRFDSAPQKNANVRNFPKITFYSMHGYCSTSKRVQNFEDEVNFHYFGEITFLKCDLDAFVQLEKNRWFIK